MVIWRCLGTATLHEKFVRSSLNEFLMVAMMIVVKESAHNPQSARWVRSNHQVRREATCDSPDTQDHRDTRTQTERTRVGFLKIEEHPDAILVEGRESCIRVLLAKVVAPIVAFTPPIVCARVAPNVAGACAHVCTLRGKQVVLVCIMAGVGGWGLGIGIQVLGFEYGMLGLQSPSPASCAHLQPKFTMHEKHAHVMTRECLHMQRPKWEHASWLGHTPSVCSSVSSRMHTCSSMHLQRAARQARVASSFLFIMFCDMLLATQLLIFAVP
jgi:hypothetical protein